MQGPAPDRTLREPFPDVAPGCLAWPAFSERFGYDFHGWLVRHDGGALVVDPVEADGAVLDAIAAAGPRAIALTNRNHFRDAARVRERTKAKVLVHEADAEFVRGKGVPVDGALVVGGTIGPFTIVDASGKSPGEVALHDPARRILLVGDACVGPRPGVLGLLPDAVMDDPRALRRSLVRIARELDFDTLLLADGHSIARGGREALRALCATPAFAEAGS